MTDKNVENFTEKKLGNVTAFISGGFLKNKKSVIAGGFSIVSCVLAYLVGDIGVVDLMQIVVPLFGVVFLGKNIKTEMGQQLAEINAKLLSETKEETAVFTKSSKAKTEK